MAKKATKKVTKKGSKKPSSKTTKKRPASSAGTTARKAPTKMAAAPSPPRLLSGGNPQIAKADGDGPVQAYIAAMPGWKRDVGRRLDALIARTVPGVRKAVRWNSPFYGSPASARRPGTPKGPRDESAPFGDWFLSFHCISKYIKVAFLSGGLLTPKPPVESKLKDVRYLHIHEGEWDASFNEAQLIDWIRQSAAMQGMNCFTAK